MSEEKKFVKKLIKVANSFYVCIPKKIVREMCLGEGDIIEFGLIKVVYKNKKEDKKEDEKNVEVL